MEDKYNCIIGDFSKNTNTNITKNKKTHSTNYISKVVSNNIGLQNEILIKNELTKVFKSDLNKYFLFAESYELIQFGYVDNSSILEIDVPSKNNKYLVRYFKQNYINITSYLKQSKTSRIYFRRLFNIFKNLLAPINFLNDLGIVHTNLTKESIFLTSDNDEPIITNFHNAFINLHTHHYSKCLYMPPEYQLLSYKHMNNIEVLSYSNILSVINEYITNMSKIYSRYNLSYPYTANMLVSYFKQNKNTYVSSWNLYSITFMMIEIIAENIESINNQQYSEILIQIFHILEPNISPYDDKRMSIKQTYNALNNFFTNDAHYDLLIQLLNY
jgi:serine/threonine protein kinase